MTTKLNSPLKRELAIGKESYILTISPEGLKLVRKGKRNGYEMAWTSLVSGDEALAVALHASLGLAEPQAPAGRKKSSRK
jgi:hypothetical protein